MDELDFAETHRKEEEPKAACGVCRLMKPRRVVQFVDGEAICNACLAKRAGTTAGAGKRELDPATLPSPFILFMISGPGIVVTALLSVIGSMAVMMGVMALAGTKEIQSGGTTALLWSAGTLTVYNIFLSVILLASMFLVDKLLGGVGFGSISGVIWKSMLIVTVQTVLTAFSVVSDLVYYGNFLVGPVLSFLGFMWLFRLDFFESMLLSIANWVIGYVAKIAILAWVLHNALPASGDDRTPPLRIHFDGPEMPQTRPVNPPSTDNLDDEARGDGVLRRGFAGTGMGIGRLKGMEWSERIESSGDGARA